MADVAFVNWFRHDDGITLIPALLTAEQYLKMVQDRSYSKWLREVVMIAFGLIESTSVDLRGIRVDGPGRSLLIYARGGIFAINYSDEPYYYDEPAEYYYGDLEDYNSLAAHQIVIYEGRLYDPREFEVYARPAIYDPDIIDNQDNI